MQLSARPSCDFNCNTLNWTVLLCHLLNHLFVEGKSTPQEYSAPGNVAAVVIGDIAQWIEKYTPGFHRKLGRRLTI